MKFHGIYWPAFLIAAGLQPPQQLHVHSHWTVNDEKMSKSKFNMVDPSERAETYTFDGMRYFLLREGTAHSDGSKLTVLVMCCSFCIMLVPCSRPLRYTDYSDTKLRRILNSELADTLGNLLSRGCARTVNTQQRFPRLDRTAFESHIQPLDVTQRLVRLVAELPDKCYAHYKAGNFYLAVDACIEVLHTANNFFETLRPWELRKSGDIAALDAALGVTLETLRVCGILLQPVVPALSGQLLDKLSVSAEQRMWSDACRVRWQWQAIDGEAVEEQLGEAERDLCTHTDAILFRRIRVDEHAAVAKRQPPGKHRTKGSV